MNIVQEAYAGTLESSDLTVRVAPGRGCVDISVTSIVAAQFGEAIREEIARTLAQLGVNDCVVTADDRGALDCVIRARVQAAVARAVDGKIRIWEGAS